MGWTDSSIANFNDAAWCMKQQYSNQYWEIAGLNVNGNLTIGENIADNGGIREAFMAYKTWQESNVDINMPGEPFNNWSQEQLFFVGQAQVWCGKYTEARAIQLQKTDPHSPGEFRVKVPAQNLEEFGKAFGCKKVLIQCILTRRIPAEFGKPKLTYQPNIFMQYTFQNIKYIHGSAYRYSTIFALGDKRHISV